MDAPIACQPVKCPIFCLTFEAQSSFDDHYFLFLCCLVSVHQSGCALESILCGIQETQIKLISSHLCMYLEQKQDCASVKIKIAKKQLSS